MTAEHKHNLKLVNGSRVAVIGGGPAGSFFSLFLLEFAKDRGLDICVDIYDCKDFSRCGLPGCNHCGGIISASLVQTLTTVIPDEKIQKGIGSYVLHTDVGNVEIETHLAEKRIAAVYRGSGPQGAEGLELGSFDEYLQGLAVEKGAELINEQVKKISFDADRPLVKISEGPSVSYDLLVGAIGVNTSALKLFEGLDGYIPPQTTKTFICEFSLGRKMVQKHFGNSKHVFLLNIPRFEFAALIPKGDYVTLVLLGKKLEKEAGDELVDSFLNTPEVRECFPPDFELTRKKTACRCKPKINIKSAMKPYADRVVLVGDCATTKLYKNGIDTAHDTAMVAARTAISKGISNNDFRKHYWPTCQAIDNDNKYGWVVFAVISIIRKIRFARRGILRMAAREQQKKKANQRMSMVLWDSFTGSADYKDIFLRTIKLSFLTRLLWEIIIGFLPFSRTPEYKKKNDQDTNLLGKTYKDRVAIVTQGETGDCMYLIQSGKVGVFHLQGGKEIKISEMGAGESFGEMALFDKEVRSATVRSIGESIILTIDNETSLLDLMENNPLRVLEIIRTANNRIRRLTEEVSRLKVSDRRDWGSLPDKK